jgi:hypothetical protein
MNTTLPLWWTLLTSDNLDADDHQENEAEREAENARILEAETAGRIASTRFTGSLNEDPEEWRGAAY